ncbi:hypothetical protein [Geodermatophilus chilensis]|uniref:hypothetical protein n=1 Tax=Geodermatophilus chilensis TaxID=2035835 RepID=UPI001E5CD515|nr:hypothetical protein [Geodermatophilus chilensis]
MQQLTRTCQAAARGDLEARSRPTTGVADVPELQALNDAVNSMLDVSDAFVREASAALTSAAASRFHRSVLLGGLAGAYRGEPPTSTPRATPCRRPRAGSPRPTAPGCGWPTSSRPSSSPPPSRWRRRRRR